MFIIFFIYFSFWGGDTEVKREKGEKEKRIHALLAHF